MEAEQARVSKGRRAIRRWPAGNALRSWRTWMLGQPQSSAISVSANHSIGEEDRYYMQQDQRTKQILESTYIPKVQAAARRAYLQASALVRELDGAKLNPEDSLEIKMHIVNMLSLIRTTEPTKNP